MNNPFEFLNNPAAENNTNNNAEAQIQALQQALAQMQSQTAPKPAPKQIQGSYFVKYTANSKGQYNGMLVASNPPIQGVPSQEITWGGIKIALRGDIDDSGQIGYVPLDAADVARIKATINPQPGDIVPFEIDTTRHLPKQPGSNRVLYKTKYIG